MPSAEHLLHDEVALLEKQKLALELSVTELKLRHERDARSKAITMAQGMIAQAQDKAGQAAAVEAAQVRSS